MTKYVILILLPCRLLGVPETEKKGSGKMAKRRRKLKTKKLITTILLLALLCFIGWGVHYIYQTLQMFNNSRTELPSDLSELGITSQPAESGLIDDTSDASITNIALFGVDRRTENEAARSDVIMIATVDKRHNKIKLASVMRDSYVPIDGHGKTKLNSAYFYGGPTLAIKTLNQLFGLNITDYVTVNFSEMAAIVDAVGGVEIDISEAERKDANHNMIEQAAMDGSKVDTIEKAGLQTLSGMQAVGYARIRYVGNADFERTQRQRSVMQAIFKKGKSMNPLQYPDMIQKMLPVVETSLELGEIMDMAGILLRDVSMEDVRFPCNEDLIDGGSLKVDGVDYLYYDLEATRQKLHDFIYNDLMPAQP